MPVKNKALYESVEALKCLNCGAGMLAINSYSEML
jgi:hypothetical protein